MASNALIILPGIMVLVLLAGFLSAADAALSGFSRARSLELIEEQRPGAQLVAQVVADPARYINTTIFLRLLTEISAVVLATVGFQLHLDSLPVAILSAISVMVVVSFVVIGVGPRTLGRQYRERVALNAAVVVVVLTRVLGPIPRILIAIGNALTPGRGFMQGPFTSETTLRELVDLAEARRAIESDEREMIHSVFELDDTYVREVMVPRTEVVYIDHTKTLRQAMSLFLRSGFSRLPVVEENLDATIGLVYFKDVARRIYDRHDAESVELVTTVMRPATWVPDSKPADMLLRDMQAARTHMAIVVDEYGGMAGLVTIEDVLEEIVGEITDEFDTDDQPVVPCDGGGWRVSTRFALSDLAQLLDADIDDDEVDSVGGFMAKQLGMVPLPGATLELAGWRFVADEVQGRRNQVGSVMVTPLEPEATEELTPTVSDRITDG